MAFGFIKSQVNYVKNPSFEYASNCGDPFGGFITLATPWDTLHNGGGYGIEMNKCYPQSSNCGVPYNLSGGGYQVPRTGNAYAYMIFLKFTPNPAVNWRGYIQQKMANKLTAGKSYCVTYWASLVNYVNYGVDELSGYFDDGSIQSIGVAKEAIANPQVKSPSGVFYADTLKWMKVQGSFTANGTEEYITIGNFRTTAATTFTALDGNTTAGIASYFIDDVSVIETNLPAFAGADKYVILGDSVFIGRPSEIGLDDDCFWYKLPNTTTPIDTVAGLWVKPVVTTTYVVKQDICGTVKWDTVVVNKGYVGLNELVIKNDNIILSPNPVNEKLNIQFNINDLDKEFTKAEIINSVGQLVRIIDLNYINKQAVIDIKELSNGVYLLNLKSNKSQSINKRFVVTK